MRSGEPDEHPQDEERDARRRQFSRRELLRAGTFVPVALSLPIVGVACGGGHTDSAHSDHTDAGSHNDHGDATHADTPHGDSRGGHSDSHSNVHSDGHHDVAHVDFTHDDTAHGDSQHGDHHDDVAAFKGATNHTDAGQHLDQHYDSPHQDSHLDTPHTDIPHTDEPHGDHTDS